MLTTVWRHTNGAREDILLGVDETAAHSVPASFGAHGSSSLRFRIRSHEEIPPRQIRNLLATRVCATGRAVCSPKMDKAKKIERRKNGKSQRVVFVICWEGCLFVRERERFEGS